jgi:hypothetical protein
MPPELSLTDSLPRSKLHKFGPPDTVMQAFWAMVRALRARNIHDRLLVWADHSYERSVRLHDVLKKDCRGAQHASRAGGAPCELAVCAHDRVEAGQVLVEAKHMPDGRRVRIARVAAYRPAGGLNAQLAVGSGEVNRARAVRNGAASSRMCVLRGRAGSAAAPRPRAKRSCG